MSSLEKSKKRKDERQRQRDLMKVAVGSDEYDEEGDDEGLTKRGGGKPSADPSLLAMESARRFLWEEDDEEVEIPLGGPSPNITLTGTQSLFSSKEYVMKHNVAVVDAKETKKSGFMGGLFRGRGSADKTQLSKGQDRSSGIGRAEVQLAKKQRSMRKSASTSPLAKCFKCLLLLLAVAAFIGGILGLVFLLTKEEELKEEESVSSGDNRVDALYAKLSPHSSINLKDEGTAQYKAFHWLANQDQMKLRPTDDDLLQRYVLAVFFFSASGQINEDGSAKVEWTNHDAWMSGQGICSWYGVECVPEESGKEGMVFGLNMTSNGMRGTLPAELKSLRLLGKLDLSQNEIEGTLPKELAYTQNLIDLILRDNKLTGSIPSDFGEMSVLHELNLGENSLTGGIPSTLNQATKMRAMSLEKNSFQGTIPNFGSLKFLETLYLGHNELQGEIPKTLYELTSLVDLRLNRNQLSGTIADQMRNLDNIKFLHLTQNKFKGPLPNLFERLTDLVEVYIGKNKFTGTLPGTIGQLSNVEHFHLDENQFSGPLHENIRHLKSLKELDLHENSFTGSIPDDVFENMSNLEVCMLYGNDFVGKIPKSLGSCTKLREIFLESNQLSGEVPTELGSLQSLGRLSVDKNSVTGTMPNVVCELTSGNLDYLAADCKDNEIVCECCDECF